MSDAPRWEALTAFSDTYTCYSAAVAAWAAHDRDDWRPAVNPGLWLAVVDSADGVFGFAHFPPQLRARLGLVRMGAPRSGGDGVAGVLDEIERSGRVIVAGDAFRLPWHVAHGRRHLPHWFVLAGAPDRLEVVDPFACRNELGVQAAARHTVAVSDLAELVVALPAGDRVLDLRERFGLGDDSEPPPGDIQWFVRGEAGELRAPGGAEGPAGVLALSLHMREHGQDPAAYTQADDIWSIGRHRAFLARHAADVAERTGHAALAAWVVEHAEPLAKRWGHMAPLLMQASLALAAGRQASASVPDTLEELSRREQAAAQAFPADLDVGTI